MGGVALALATVVLSYPIGSITFITFRFRCFEDPLPFVMEQEFKFMLDSDPHDDDNEPRLKTTALRETWLVNEWKPSSGMPRSGFVRPWIFDAACAVGKCALLYSF